MSLTISPYAPLSGKYIIRLDADDYFAANALEQMSGKLEANPELGMVFPNYYYIDEKDQVIGEEIRHDFDNNKLACSTNQRMEHAP